MSADFVGPSGFLSHQSNCANELCVFRGLGPVGDSFAALHYFLIAEVDYINRILITFYTCPGVCSCMIQVIFLLHSFLLLKCASSPPEGHMQSCFIAV